MTSLRHFTLGLVLPLAIGCGGGADLPELGTVAGLLTDGGKPVAGATVAVYPEKGSPSFATTGEDGRFEMSYGAGLPGAVVGLHKVRVTTPAAPRRPLPVNADEPILGPTKTRAMPAPVQVEPGENSVEFDLARTR